MVQEIESELKALQAVLPTVSPRLAMLDHVLIGALEHVGKFIDKGQSPQAAASSVTSLTDAAVNAAQTVQQADGSSIPTAVATTVDHLDPAQDNADALDPDGDDDAPSPDTVANAANANAQQQTMALTQPVAGS